MTDDVYLRIKQVIAVTGLSRATIYNMMATGAFPMKTALGARAVGWLASELQIWMAGRKLVEKQGVEATPARRKSVPGKVRSHNVQRAASTQVEPMNTEVATSKHSDWIDDAPPPTLAEQHAISERLRVINTMRREKAKKTSPVKVRVKTSFSYDVLRQSAATATQSKIEGAAPLQVSFKRKR